MFCGIAYASAYQFMCYMAKAKYTESGQIIDSGVDLNMEGGIAEYAMKLLTFSLEKNVKLITYTYLFKIFNYF